MRLVFQRLRDPECAVRTKGSKGKSILLIHTLKAQAYNPNSSGDSHILGHLGELRSSFKTKQKKIKKRGWDKVYGEGAYLAHMRAWVLSPASKQTKKKQTKPNPTFLRAKRWSVPDT